jgi:nitroreductase
MEAIHRRRSVREFAAGPIEQAVLLQLIDAAVWAPSAVNEQPWHFTVVQDQQKLDAVSSHAKAHMLAAQGTAMPGDLREALSDPDFQIFHHAPTLILISADSDAPSAKEDCALAAENLMLAAFAESLGTCWVGSAACKGDAFMS